MLNIPVVSQAAYEKTRTMSDVLGSNVSTRIRKAGISLADIAEISPSDPSAHPLDQAQSAGSCIW